MADWDSQQRRWAELMDRKAVGEALSDEERAFCERLTAEHPACRREAELLDELADLHVAPSAESRALVDATLARLAAEAQSAERDELSQLKRAPRVPRLVWASGLAAAAAVAAAVLWMPHERASAPVASAPQPAARVELVYASGEVQVDGKPVTSSSTLLAEGSKLEVGQGSACLALDPDINVCLGDQTRLALTQTHGAWRRLDLGSGEAAVQLAPQPEGYRLSVVADGVWSTAVGTAFTVDRDPVQGVRTAVLHGRVRVGRDGAERMVSAHERLNVRGQQTELESISRSEESPEWALLRPARLWSNPVTASLAVRGLPAGAEVSLDGHVVGLAPLTSLIPAGGHTLEARVSGRLIAAREFASEAGQLTALSFASSELDLAPLRPAAPVEVEPVHAQAPARRAAASAPVQAVPPAPVAPTAGNLLAQAHRLMRAASFDQAAAAYQALRQAYPDSPEARAVLVSLAEVQLDRLGQPQAALGNLEQYLDGGNGALLEEARLARIRALRALGDPRQERQAIEQFLQLHPKSFKAAALKQRLLELKQP